MEPLRGLRDFPARRDRLYAPCTVRWICPGIGCSVQVERSSCAETPPSNSGSGLKQKV